MAISHADHDHDNTPAARAKCRKAMANGDLVIQSVVTGKTVKVPAPAKVTVVPRRRGDGGVVKGMQAAKPVAGREMAIKGAGDLPTDIPTNHALTIARAWERGWPVVLGDRLRDDETRILIGGELAQVALVWNVEGRAGVFVRSLTSSKTHRVDSGPQAIALASGDEEWPWVNAGKLV